MKKILILFLIFSSILQAISKQHISENFIQIILPKNVSIELPKNWIIIGNHKRITLDSAIEASIDLSNNKQIKSKLKLL